MTLKKDYVSTPETELLGEQTPLVKTEIGWETMPTIKLTRSGDTYIERVTSLNGSQQNTLFPFHPPIEPLLKAMGADLSDPKRASVAKKLAPLLVLLPEESAILDSNLSESTTGIYASLRIIIHQNPKYGDISADSTFNIALQKKKGDESNKSLSVSANVSTKLSQNGIEIAKIEDKLILFRNNPAVSVETDPQGLIAALSEKAGQEKQITETEKGAKREEPNPADFIVCRSNFTTQEDNNIISKYGDHQVVHHKKGAAGETVLGQFAPELKDEVTLCYGVKTVGFGVIVATEKVAELGKIGENHHVSEISFALLKPVITDRSTMTTFIKVKSEEEDKTVVEVIIMRKDGQKPSENIKDGLVAAVGTITYRKRGSEETKQPLPLAT